MSDSTVYVLMPTAGAVHAQEQIDKWRALGYGVGLWLDPGNAVLGSDFYIQRAYPGVWRAVNELATVAFDRGADVCVFAGDDMDPEPSKRAEEIAAEYLGRFPDGFGVMQPCGDPQGELIAGKHNAGRICGSAWFGRGWHARAFGGRGPTPDRYYHFYGDEELYVVAGALGVRWMRDDLTQWHRHWSFPGGLPRQEYHERTNREHWDTDQRTYFASKAAGFPEGCPLGMDAGEYAAKIADYRKTDGRA